MNICVLSYVMQIIVCSCLRGWTWWYKWLATETVNYIIYLITYIITLDNGYNVDIVDEVTSKNKLEEMQILSIHVYKSKYDQLIISTLTF